MADKIDKTSSVNIFQGAVVSEPGKEKEFFGFNASDCSSAQIIQIRGEPWNVMAPTGSLALLIEPPCSAPSVAQRAEDDWLVTYCPRCYALSGSLGPPQKIQYRFGDTCDACKERGPFERCAAPVAYGRRRFDGARYVRRCRRWTRGGRCWSHS